MAKKLVKETRLNFTWDGFTEDGRALVSRVTLPVGTDRRRIKRLMRKYFERMGHTDVDYVMHKMGMQKYVR